MRNIKLIFLVIIFAVSLSAFSQQEINDSLSQHEFQLRDINSGHGDCESALPLCNDFTNISPSTGDLGSVNDESNASCFSGTGGTGAIWYTFNPQTAGNLGFDLNPTGSTDYDFALFDITNGCENMQLMSCNFSVESGNTGMTTNSGDVSDSHSTFSYEDCESWSNNTADENCGRWNEDENVDPTHTYVLLVNFYGGNNDGFTIDFQAFSNTVSIGDQIPPTFADVTQPGCNGSVIDITFSELIDCTTLDDSDFSIPGYTVTLGSYSCNNGMTNQISLNVSAALTPGSYTLTGVDVFDLCGNELDDSFSFTIVPQTIDVSLSGNDFCEGGSATITTTVTGTGNYTYAWSNGASTSSISVSSAGNYCVTVTDDCSISDSDCITINEDPTPVISVSTVCDGSGNNADLTATGCSGTLTWYEWGEVSSTISISNAQECIDCAEATPNYFFGMYTGCSQSTCATTTTDWVNIGSSNSTTVSTPFSTQYMAECVSASGCSVQEVFVVDCNTPISVTVNSETICNGNCDDISATVSGGTAPYSYAWSPASITGAGPNNVCPTVTTVYSVTVTDVDGETASASGTITVNPSPTVDAGTNVSICEGESTSLNATGASTYIWDNGLGTGNTQTVSPTSTTTYTVTGTDANGCTDSDVVVVTVNTNPTPTVTGSDFCEGFNTTLNAGAGFVAYNWSVGGFTTQQINILSAGTYTVTVTDANGCSGTDDITINENTNPTPTITGVNFCAGTSTVLDAGVYSSWAWSNSDVAQTSTITAGGTYTVTVTDANGCSGTDDIIITEYTNPTPIITGSDFCAGTSTVLDAGSYSSWVWSNSDVTQTSTITTGGTYTVTVTDANGCLGSDDILIVANPLPTPNILGSDFCLGSSSVLDAGSYSSWNWSSGGILQNITVTTAGTYTVTVTDANGCEASDDIIITENALPTVTITGADFCTGTHASLEAEIGFSDYTWNTLETSQLIVISTAGTYSVTVTDANGCEGTASIGISEYPLPTPTITGSLTFCTGASTILDGGGTYTDYVWNTSDMTQTLTVNNAGTYTITVTDDNGCVGSDQVNVSVGANLSPIITGVPSICNGNSTTIDAGLGYAIYNWSTNESTQTVNVGTAGTYSVTVTDAYGCSGNVDITINENPLPTPTISGSDFCLGTSTILSVNNYQTYEWNSGENTSDLLITSAGLYTVTVIDINGCEGSTNINIAEYPLPTPVIDGNNFCNGTSEVLSTSVAYNAYEWNTMETTAQITINTAGNYSVTVTDANGCESSTNSNIAVLILPTPNISGSNFCENTTTDLDAGSYSIYTWNNLETTQIISISSAGTYTVTVTDNNGCEGINSIYIDEIPSPTPTIYGNLSICEGETTELNAGNGYTSYLWNNSNNSQAITVSNAGLYSVTVTNADGCEGVTAVNLVQHSLPTPTITGNSAICMGDNANLDAGSGYNNYLWSTYENNQTINIGTAGMYAVTVTDNFGCEGSDIFSMNINNLSITTSPGVASICAGTDIDVSVTVVTGVPSYTYIWSNGFGGTSQTISPDSDTSFTVYVTDGMGCVSELQTITIAVMPGVQLNMFTNIDTICPGEPLLVTSLAQQGVPPYTLYNEANNVVTFNSVIYPNTEGEFYYTVIDACNSTDTDKIDINLYPIPVLNPTADVLKGCSPFEVHFLEENNLSNLSSYLWSFDDVNDNNLSFNPSPTHVFETEGVYDVSLTVTTSDGCKLTKLVSDMITVFPKPEAHFQALPDIASIINPTLQFDNYSEGASNYLWHFDDGDSSNVFEPSHKFDNISDYQVLLIAVSDYGCKDTATHIVRIVDEFTLYVPTAFSPDRDGINDGFRVEGHGIDNNNFLLSVYNRWGELIWQSTDMYEYWLAKTKNGNNFVQNGVYVWKVNCKDFYGIEHEKAGTVTVIK